MRLAFCYPFAQSSCVSRSRPFSKRKTMLFASTR
ncbi:unnamed protein product [Linum tenue]|uniref:Uncharacterized protein n=1 Tax=Linum tenue TaxID=586396 RepID=A0AAV0N3V8_9ROSI|nr:unnamed protein product [Linum tenue]